MPDYLIILFTHPIIYNWLNPVSIHFKALLYILFSFLYNYLFNSLFANLQTCIFVLSINQTLIKQYENEK